MRASLSRMSSRCSDLVLRTGPIADFVRAKVSDFLETQAF